MDDAVDRLREVAARHPRWVDAGLAAVAAGITGPGALAGVDAVAGVCFAAVHVVLVWRRRAPVTVFWLAYAFAFAASLGSGIRVQGAYPELELAIAVYTVARYSSRHRLVFVVAAIAVPTVVAFLVIGPQWLPLAFVVSLVAATTLLGITVSTRQAYLAELEERAHRLERERDQQATIAAAAERARIARDMHDVVAHSLTVMIALADGAARSATGAPERAADAMAKVSATGREALGEMRRLLGVLQDAGDSGGRSPQPGLDDLEALVTQVRSAGPRVTLAVDGVPGAWGPGAGLAVYRIVQEALTNTLKHAGPDAVARVRLRYAADGVEIEVTDDGGRRPRAPQPGDGHGLAGMAERAAAFGGVVTAEPAADGPGWRVHARLRPAGPA
jgi:signal transduction histidine kinase